MEGVKTAALKKENPAVGPGFEAYATNFTLNGPVCAAVSTG
jgi:hypothetical protein